MVFPFALQVCFLFHLMLLTCEFADFCDLQYDQGQGDGILWIR